MHLVLVHLGPGKAAHLRLNIEHIKKYFPELPITLVVTSEANSDILNIRNIEYFNYSRSRGSQVNTLNHNDNFRQGFWVYSLERLLALGQWAESKKIEKFLHIESDILLLPNFPMDYFENLEKLTWSRYNQNRDVASFIFSPNIQETNFFVSKVDEILWEDKLATDMTVLSRISHSYPERINLLPSNPAEISDGVLGIFDPAHYGMWLTGQDPRNNWGRIRRFIDLEESETRPSKYRYTFRWSGTLHLKSEQGIYPIYNLHVHSKRKSLFRKTWRFALYFDVLNSKKRIFSSTYSFESIKSLIDEFNTRHPRKREKIKVLKKLIIMKTN